MSSVIKEEKLLDFWEDRKVWSNLDFGVLNRKKNLISRTGSKEA